MLRHYVTKNGKTMRCGYTTGSCAAGAAGAATQMLLTGRTVERLDMDTPSLKIVHNTFYTKPY